MLKKAYSFLKFFFKAKTKYKVHSPFVYDFIESVFEDNRVYYIFFPIEYCRIKLYRNKDVIKVNDLGAGSKIFSKNQRSISNIAKNSLQKKKTAQLLFRLINKHQFNSVIEIGTSLGITTAYLSTARRDANIYTIEGCVNTLQVAKSLGNQLKLKNVNYINGHFNEELPKLLQTLKTVDFAYFDWNHTKKATLEYFNLCKKKAVKNSVFVFDDIYWSAEMQDAWECIKKDEDVTLSIDLFQIGIVFFHPVKIKRHFQIRKSVIFSVKELFNIQ